jgi:hypothetical protein
MPRARLVVGEQGVIEADRPCRVKARLRSPSASPDGPGLDPSRPARGTGVVLTHDQRRLP